MSETLGKTQQKHFTFDRSFQDKIVQAMIIDRAWAAQFAEVLDVNYFEVAYLKIIADKYVEYHKKYKEFPSMELLATVVSNDLKNEKDSILRTQAHTFLGKIPLGENLGDLPYVKEKALDWCRKQGLQQALEASVELIVNEDYDKVAGVIKRALAAGEATTAGIELGVDIDARYSETYRKVVPTGIRELDQKTILNGGLGAGELGCIVAATGVGKSHALVHIGAEALKHGKNVLQYSFELRERIVGIRYDSNLLGINSSDLFEHIEEIKNHYATRAEYGKLIIKEYPTSTVTCNQIRNHIDRLSTTNFRPDIIIIDYAGIMRSSERYDAPRFELKKVFEELRTLAMELDVPIWTAAQSNKEGANAELVDMTHMAEAYAQAHICDFILGITRKPEMKSTGYGKLFIAKNRAGLDGIQMHMHMDTARSKIKVISDAEAVEYIPDDFGNAPTGGYDGGKSASKEQTKTATAALRDFYRKQLSNKKPTNGAVTLDELADRTAIKLEKLT